MTTATGTVTVSVIQPGSVNTATGTVSITIVQPPVSTTASFTTPYNTVLNGSLITKASDPNNPALPLTFSIVTPTAHGTLTLVSSGTFTYTPVSTYSGSDSFTYVVNNGYLNSNTSTVNITVSGSISGPTTQSINFTTSVNGNISTSISQYAVSPQGYTLTFTLATLPGHGTATLTTSGIFTYTPTSGFSGTDVCTYTVTDGHGGSSTAAITIIVTGSIPPPPPPTSPPNIQVTILNAQPGDIAVITNVTVTSFSVKVLNNGTAVSRYVNWVATAF